MTNHFALIGKGIGIINNFSFGSSFEGTLKKTMEKNSKERPFLYVAGFWDEKIENIKVKFLSY